MIILDDTYGSFRCQKENGIRVKGWRGDMEDRELDILKEMLMNVVRSDSEDVKVNISAFKVEQSRKGTITVDQNATVEKSSI
jgi:TFIIF-interacting CTD phosphatase-like protein